MSALRIVRGTIKGGIQAAKAVYVDVGIQEDEKGFQQLLMHPGA
jgi:hypothetical protein